MAENPVILSGWCSKLSPAASGKWQKRWLVLTSEALFYSSSEKSTPPSGHMIRLELDSWATFIRQGVDSQEDDSYSPSGRMLSILWRKISKPHVFSFQAQANEPKWSASRYQPRRTSRTWYFRVDSDEIRRQWVVAINTANDEVLRKNEVVKRYMERAPYTALQLQAFLDGKNSNAPRPKLTPEAVAEYLVEVKRIRAEKNTFGDNFSVSEVLDVLGAQEIAQSMTPPSMDHVFISETITITTYEAAPSDHDPSVPPPSTPENPSSRPSPDLSQ